MDTGGEDTVKTLSHQSVLDGVLGLKLEIPYSMRRKLVSDDDFFKWLAEALLSPVEAWMLSLGGVGTAASVKAPLAALGHTVAIEERTCLSMLEDLRAMDLRMMDCEKMI